MIAHFLSKGDYFISIGESDWYTSEVRSRPWTFCFIVMSSLPKIHFYPMHQCDVKLWITDRIHLNLKLFDLHYISLLTIMQSVTLIIRIIHGFVILSMSALWHHMACCQMDQGVCYILYNIVKNNEGVAGATRMKYLSSDLWMLSLLPPMLCSAYRLDIIDFLFPPFMPLYGMLLVYPGRNVCCLG